MFRLSSIQIFINLFNITFQLFLCYFILNLLYLSITDDAKPSIYPVTLRLTQTTLSTIFKTTAQKFSQLTIAIFTHTIWQYSTWIMPSIFHSWRKRLIQISILQTHKKLWFRLSMLTTILSERILMFILSLRAHIFRHLTAINLTDGLSCILSIHSLIGLIFISSCSLIASWSFIWLSITRCDFMTANHTRVLHFLLFPNLIWLKTMFCFYPTVGLSKGVFEGRRGW